MPELTTLNPALRENSELPAAINTTLSWRALANCSSARARACLPYAIAKAEKVLPLSLLESVGGALLLTVVCDRQLGFDDLQRLRFETGMDIVCETVHAPSLEKALSAAYRGSKQEYQTACDVAQRSCSASSVVSVAEKSEGPVPRLLDSMIERALFLNATDIHLESDADGYLVRLRIDGMLREENDFCFSQMVGQTLIRRLRVLCNLPSGNRRAGQEGGFSYCEGGYSVRLRVSILEGVKGETAVLRLLDNALLEELCAESGGQGLLGALGMPPYEQSLVYACVGRGSGTILAVGPTGSGKSTLLYALLDIINDGTRKILTIEDPVERLVKGATQLELPHDRSIGFNELLKAGLRQDPDAVLLGEIRDAATAHTALTAGITGHLVLSSTHCNDTLEAIGRLRGLKIDRELMAESLRLIICPRLLPLVCAKCRTAYPHSTKLAQLLNIKPRSFVFGKGCDACAHSGCSGTAAVFEMLAVTHAVKDALLSKANRNLLTQAAEQQYASGQLASLRDKIFRLLEGGKIAPKTALRVLGIAPQLLGFGSR